MLKIHIADNAGFKFAKKQNSKQFRQIWLSIMALAQNPRPHDSKKLKGSNDIYRIDVGEFRIIYEFNNENLIVRGIGKRNDDEVYKKFSRK